jgi:hypothetical protein
MFQQPGQGAGGAAAAARRKFGTSIDVNSTRNGEAAGKGGKAGVGGVEKRTTRSMASSSSSSTRSGQMRDDSDAPRPAIQQQRASSTASGHHSRSSSFNVSNPSSYQHTGQVDNIDDRDREDPLCATDYVQEMVSITIQWHQAVAYVRPTGISSTHTCISFNRQQKLTRPMCHSLSFPPPNRQITSTAVHPLPRKGRLHFCPTDVHGEPDPHQRADARHPRRLAR